MKSLKQRLLKYFKATSGILPFFTKSMDSYSVSGLGLLSDTLPSDAEHLIDFIYAHQIPPTPEYKTRRCGFRGSTFIGTPLTIDEGNNSAYFVLPYDSCHVTMTYSALVSLLVLGDDLSRVNRQAIIDGIKALQYFNGNLINGSIFCPEFDIRFIFSAVASAYILDMLEQLDLNAFEEFLLDSITYEGGFGSKPKLEAHAGTTYCALASLKLMDRLSHAFPAGSFQRQRLIDWLLSRQRGGFNGRSQKDPDTCYTFWVGASLKMLNAHQYVDKTSLLNFILSTYEPVVGGFMKAPDADNADLLHSYMALAGLSCLFNDKFSPESTANTTDHVPEPCNSSDLGELPSDDMIAHLDQLIADSLQPLVPELNLPLNAFQRLMNIHAKWRSLPF